MTREVILYTRSECGLCDDAADVLRPLQSTLGFTLREVDIDNASGDVRTRFTSIIPVVELEGRVIASAPFGADELRALVKDALRG